MPGARSGLVDSTPEAETISDAQVACLLELISKPSRYTQRCVEQLAFLPAGGEQWKRTVQLRIPPSKRSGEQWWPVSLGTFRRKRYPDLAVTDGVGHRIPLLTRRQHDHALARVVLGPYVEMIRAVAPRSSLTKNRLDKRSAKPYNQLVRTMSAFLALIPVNEQKAEEHARRVGNAFGAYALALGLSQAKFRPIAFALGVRVARENRGRDTRYLCWVRASPGEVVTLTANYSAFDFVRRPSRAPKRVKPKDDDYTPLSLWWLKVKRNTPATLMGLCQKFGIAPLRYSLLAPANTAANSYYFTILPPSATNTLALISNEEGSHSDDGDLDSSARCFHVHNETSTDAQRSAAVLWPYLMPERREHMVVAAGALLNIAFVLLVSRGRFVNGFSAQTWLLITPTVLTGIIAQQQSHYYAYATRYQRTLLWLYLATGVAFLVVVTFSNSHIPGTEAGWGPTAKTIFIAFATISALISVVYAALGPTYQATTERRARRLAQIAKTRRDKRNPHLVDSVNVRCWVGREAVIRYQRAVLEYCAFVLTLATLFASGVCGVGIWMWQHDKFTVSARTVGTKTSSNDVSETTAGGRAIFSPPTFPPVTP